MVQAVTVTSGSPAAADAQRWPPSRLRKISGGCTAPRSDALSLTANTVPGLTLCVSKPAILLLNGRPVPAVPTRPRHPG